MGGGAKGGKPDAKLRESFSPDPLFTLTRLLLDLINKFRVAQREREGEEKERKIYARALTKREG